MVVADVLGWSEVRRRALGAADAYACSLRTPRDRAAELELPVSAAAQSAH
jgi:hypothetical protein